MSTPAQKSVIIDIAPGSVADPYRYVPAILLPPATGEKAERLGLPADVPAQVWPARDTAGFAIAAAITLREQAPGSVAVVYMHSPQGFESPNGLQPRPTKNVDRNGKPLFMYVVG